MVHIFRREVLSLCSGARSHTPHSTLGSTLGAGGFDLIRMVYFLRRYLY